METVRLRKYSDRPRWRGCWKYISRALICCQRGLISFATRAQFPEDCSES